MKQPHIHSYDSIKIVKVIADNPKYDMSKNGAWSFITRYCNCGAERTLDMVHRQDAEGKLEALINS